MSWYITLKCTYSNLSRRILTISENRILHIADMWQSLSHSFMNYNQFKIILNHLLKRSVFGNVKDHTWLKCACRYILSVTYSSDSQRQTCSKNYARNAVICIRLTGIKMIPLWLHSKVAVHNTCTHACMVNDTMVAMQAHCKCSFHSLDGQFVWVRAKASACVMHGQGLHMWPDTMHRHWWEMLNN